MLNYFIFTIACTFQAGSLIWINWLTARTQPSGVRVIWYFFSLSVVLTGEIGLHARQVNAIDEKGQFVGDYGHLLELGLRIMSDLDTDTLVLLGILIAVILPQLFTYVLSGFFGVASIPLFAGRVSTIFVWSVIKSFTVCSGIWFTISMMGAAGMFSVPKYSAMVLLSALLLLLAFSMLWAYEEGKKALIVIFWGAKKRWPHLVHPLLIVHGWFTRHQKLSETASDTSSPAFELKTLETPKI